MTLRHACRAVADKATQTVLAKSDRLPTYYNGKILWPHRNTWTSTYSAYEPHIARELSRLLRPGSSFWDVGANIGWLSLLASSLVGTEGRVEAFEPAPDVFRALSLNVAHRANVHAHNVGIGDADGIAEFSSQGMASSASFVEDVTKLNAVNLPNTDITRVSIPVMRLDTFLNQAEPPSLLKIDVEGYELHALNGASKLLSLKPPALIEIHPVQLSLSGGSESAIYDLLSGYGYSWRTLHRDKNTTYQILAT